MEWWKNELTNSKIKLENAVKYGRNLYKERCNHP